MFISILQKIQIAQKWVKYSPAEKLMNAFRRLLEGRKGLVEVNVRLKAEVGLQFDYPAVCTEADKAHQGTGTVHIKLMNHLAWWGSYINFVRYHKGLVTVLEIPLEREG